MKTTMLYLFIATIWQFVTATGTLSSRQDAPPIPANGVPSSCAGNCSTPMLQNCLSMTNMTCLCNPALETALFNCLLCLGQMDGDFTEAQSSINVLVGACDSLGLTISDLTFPGQTATSVGSPSASSNGIPSPVSTSNSDTTGTPPASTTNLPMAPSTTPVGSTPQSTSTSTSPSPSPSPSETGSNTTTTNGSKPVGHATVLWTVMSILLLAFILQ